MNTHPKCKRDPSKRNPDGSILLQNPNIVSLTSDYLYHIGLSASSNLAEQFGDVKFVCMGGKPKRMLHFAEYIQKELGLPGNIPLRDLSAHEGRYCMYKIGPVLSISHGMGESSFVILLHEVIKLMYYAKCKDPIFFRIGSCGGIGIEGGTVAISTDAIDGMMNNHYALPVLGKLLERPAVFDKELAIDLKAIGDSEMPFKVVTGTTMGALDFYEGQGRIDGAFCKYTEKDKMDYLNKLKSKGVVNIEMEAVPFSALTYEAGIKAADVCVAFLNRLNGDQVTSTPEERIDWEERPQKLIAQYIKKHL